MLWGRFTSPQKIYVIIYFQLQSQVICFSQIVYCYLYCQTEIHDDVGTLAGSCFGQSYFLLCAERKRLVLITDKTFSLSFWVFELSLNWIALPQQVIQRPLEKGHSSWINWWRLPGTNEYTQVESENFISTWWMFLTLCKAIVILKT